MASLSNSISSYFCMKYSISVFLRQLVMYSIIQQDYNKHVILLPFSCPKPYCHLYGYHPCDFILLFDLPYRTWWHSSTKTWAEAKKHFPKRTIRYQNRCIATWLSFYNIFFPGLTQTDFFSGLKSISTAEKHFT